MMFEKQMQYVLICVYVKFSKRECQQWRMVLCEWCQLWDHSAFVLKQALDWRVEHVSRGGGGRAGEGTPIQVCAAENKVLSIKQDIEFYY